MPSRFRPGVTEMARDDRHVWMAFPVEDVEASDLGVSDYRQIGERSVTGNVERDPVSLAEKAKLNIEVEAETTPLRQLAVFIDKVPAKLIEAVDTFEDFLTSELSYQLSVALDAHVLAAITAAEPTKGETGTGLWVKIRQAVKAMRAQGGKPSVLAVSPDVAAELDTMTAGADDLPVFPLGAVGGSSPLFGLTIIEVPGLTKPLLIDPTAAGVLYLGAARVFADPFSGLAKNEVRLRVECEALMWVRDANGLYSIDKAA